jgi:DNA-binding transcriptional LysR family regulator
MRTEQLEYVAAVARFGSFRRAAAELHISQPALSTTVRNLERELGVQILERGRSGARVSQAGRELLAHVTAVIDAVDGPPTISTGPAGWCASGPSTRPPFPC